MTLVCPLGRSSITSTVNAPPSARSGSQHPESPDSPGRFMEAGEANVSRSGLARLEQVKSSGVVFDGYRMIFGMA